MTVKTHPKHKITCPKITNGLQKHALGVPKHATGVPKTVSGVQKLVLGHSFFFGSSILLGGAQKG
jgi:hypothetical protein